MRRTDNEMYRIAMWETVINWRSPHDESTQRDLKDNYNLTKKQLDKILIYMDEIYQKKFDDEVYNYRKAMKRKRKEEELVKRVAEKLEKEKRK